MNLTYVAHNFQYIQREVLDTWCWWEYKCILSHKTF